MSPCIRTYRRIQILEQSFNAALMGRVVPALMLCAPSIQIIGMYVCINLREEIPMPGFLIFPLMGLDCGVCNVMVITMASWIHNVSIKVLSALNRRAGQMQKIDRGISRRQVSSSYALKVKFGSNFMDRGTPLVIQNFCLTQTMSLILIQRR